MTDLLPCPFCGGEAKRHDIEAREDVDNAGASYIECVGCGACTQLHFDRKENLLDSWNRRKLTETIHSSRVRLLEAGEVLWRENDRALREEIKKHMTNVRHWREECGKLHAKLATRYDPTTQPFDEPFTHVQNDQVTISLDHYTALIHDHQKLTQMEALDIEECGNHSAGSPP